MRQSQAYDLAFQPASKTKNVQVMHVEETDPEDTHYNIVLETLVYGLLELSKDKAFRELVIGEVRKQFDGDYNVLLRTLNEVCKAERINLRSEFEQSINRYSLANKEAYLQLSDEAILGFDYNGEKAYPQIYIPFFEQINLDEEPILVLNLDNGEPTAPAYRLNKSGALEEIWVDESYAQKHHIWVISMNETVGSEADIARLVHNGNELPRDSEKIRPSETASASREWNVSVGPIFIHRIYITDKKESWLNGKAEVSYVSNQFYMPNPASYYYPCTTFAPYNGIPFKKVGSGDLNKWITISGGPSGANKMADI
ncbi:MAG: hypothetical protein D6730_02900, partial [Bacteroidetes bacterium]